MTTTQLTLDKKTYPLMMHLGILPKYDNTSLEKVEYDPITQTSNIDGMSGSWCTRNTSTGGGLFEKYDSDQKEDD